MESQRYIRNVPNVIVDRPAYPYRGLMLDTARNWFDVPTIRKLIDTMSFVKLNQLHWHATDTQSFPLAFEDEASGDEVRLSALAEAGSYGWTRTANGEVVRMVYTEDDIKGIIDYAGARGINVIVETDMPAHMLSGVEAIDDGDLIACPNQPRWQDVAAEPPSGQLRLVSNSTTLDTTDVNTFTIPKPISRFVSLLLRKVASLSKSVYVSSGGDEPNFRCWNLSSEAAMEPYLKPFMSLVTNVTFASGKRGMVWEEMAVKFPTVAKTLAAGSLVEIWNDPNNAVTALKNNRRSRSCSLRTRSSTSTAAALSFWAIIRATTGVRMCPGSRRTVLIPRPSSATPRLRFLPSKRARGICWWRARGLERAD